MSLDVIRCHWISLHTLHAIHAIHTLLYIIHTTYLAWPPCVASCMTHYSAPCTTLHSTQMCSVHFAHCILHVGHYTLHTALHHMAWHDMTLHTWKHDILYFAQPFPLSVCTAHHPHQPPHAIHPIKPGLQKELHIFDRPCCHNSMFDPRTTVASNTLNQHGGSMRTPLYFTASYGYGASNVWTHFSWNGFRSQNGQNHFPGGSKKFKAGKPNHFLCAISILFINASISFPLKWPFKWPFSLLVRITFRLKHLMRVERWVNSHTHQSKKTKQA